MIALHDVDHLVEPLHVAFHVAPVAFPAVERGGRILFAEIHPQRQAADGALAALFVEQSLDVLSIDSEFKPTSYGAPTGAIDSFCPHGEGALWPPLNPFWPSGWPGFGMRGICFHLFLL